MIAALRKRVLSDGLPAHPQFSRHRVTALEQPANHVTLPPRAFLRSALLLHEGGPTAFEQRMITEMRVDRAHRQPHRYHYLQQQRLLAIKRIV